MCLIRDQCLTLTMTVLFMLLLYSKLSPVIIAFSSKIKSHLPSTISPINCGENISVAKSTIRGVRPTILVKFRPFIIKIR